MDKKVPTSTKILTAKEKSLGNVPSRLGFLFESTNKLKTESENMIIEIKTTYIDILSRIIN